MAIAKTRTLLSLDRYAKIMGINPVWFNGGNQIELPTGVVLFPMDNAQNMIWSQYSWQNNDQVSREDLALVIRNAESEIVDYLGYYPTPVWIESERHELPSHYRPDMKFVKLARGVEGNDVAIKTNFGYFIRGGRRKSDLVTAGSPVVYSDPDGDGWNELATITVAIPATITDYSKVKIYFAGRSGDPLYEIREFKTKSFSAGNLTFTFESWKMVDPELYEQFPNSNTDTAHIEMIDPTVFVTTVDCYHEYHDESQDHVVFYSESAVTAAITSQGGFLYQNAGDNFVMPVQGSYDAVNKQWTREASVCVYPDYVDLWYYSGMRNRPGKHPYSDDYLENDFAVAIAYLATARLERVFYANNNATALATQLRELLNESERGGTFKMTAPETMTNPFGFRRGELMAWKMIQRFKPQMRSGGAL